MFLDTTKTMGGPPRQIGISHAVGGALAQAQVSGGIAAAVVAVIGRPLPTISGEYDKTELLVLRDKIHQRKTIVDHTGNRGYMGHFLRFIISTAFRLSSRFDPRFLRCDKHLSVSEKILEKIS